MKVKRLILGYLQTNCYIISDNKYAIIIDPADNADEIINSCNEVIVKEIIVTHHHPDHMGALDDLEKYYNLKHNTFDSNLFEYKIIKTPGHTSDSISLYFEKDKILFSGDFLFKGTIGRYDFDNSSVIHMKESLNKMLLLQDDITIYPGHGDKTILGHEKRHFKYYF